MLCCAGGSFICLARCSQVEEQPIEDEQEVLEDGVLVPLLFLFLVVELQELQEEQARIQEQGQQSRWVQHVQPARPVTRHTPPANWHVLAAHRVPFKQAGIQCMKIILNY